MTEVRGMSYLCNLPKQGKPVTGLLERPQDDLQGSLQDTPFHGSEAVAILALAWR